LIRRTSTAMQNRNARMPCVLVSRRMLHGATARSVVTERNLVSTNFER
jgi:hypothetical protein